MHEIESRRDRDKKESGRASDRKQNRRWEKSNKHIPNTHQWSCINEWLNSWAGCVCRGPNVLCISFIVYNFISTSLALHPVPQFKVWLCAWLNVSCSVMDSFFIYRSSYSFWSMLTQCLSGMHVSAALLPLSQVNRLKQNLKKVHLHLPMNSMPKWSSGSAHKGREKECDRERRGEGERERETQ